MESGSAAIPARRAVAPRQGVKAESAVHLDTASWKTMIKIIPKSECKDRVLYRLVARNFKLGVYAQERSGFIGLREKFGVTFPSIEFYRDGSAFGTAAPVEELAEILPDDILLTESMPGTWCDTCKAVVEYNGRDDWNHVQPSECKRTEPISYPNTKFQQWLAELEAKPRI
jgi:hypothetical protein